MNTNEWSGLTVNRLIKSGKADEIEATLLGRNVAPCVAREWANEPKRREVHERKRLERKARKDASKFGGRGDAWRRILRTWTVKETRLKVPHFDQATGETTFSEIVVPGREFMFHATKGVRSYRTPA